MNAAARLAELAAAPELVVVHLLEHALAALLRALRVQHPTVHHHFAPGDPPSLIAARRLRRAANRLRRDLRLYSATVSCLRDQPDHEDIPF